MRDEQSFRTYNQALTVARLRSVSELVLTSSEPSRSETPFSFSVAPPGVPGAHCSPLYVDWLV